MDGVIAVMGAALVAWGALALFVAWFRPERAGARLVRGVLMPRRLPPTRLARTLASLVPVVVGSYVLVSGAALGGPLWPSIALLVVLLVVSLGAHLQRFDA